MGVQTPSLRLWRAIEGVWGGSNSIPGAFQQICLHWLGTGLSAGLRAMASSIVPKHPRGLAEMTECGTLVWVSFSNPAPFWNSREVYCPLCVKKFHRRNQTRRKTFLGVVTGIICCSEAMAFPPTLGH